jgi:uncharacterized protein (TIGR03437 family)
LPVILTIANAQVPVIYAGSAGGSVSGLIKVQATIPANTPSGIAPVVLTVGLAPTQRNVFISIK